MAMNRAIEHYYDGMSIFYRCFYSTAGLHYGLWRRGTRSLRKALFNHKDTILRALRGVGPDSRVLDAGCGLGRTALYFHRRTGCRVTGVTLSDYQVRGAQRAARAQKSSETLTFVNADFANIPVADAAFTHAFASESFCHAADKMAVLNEFFRVLEPGGRLVIADFFLGWPRSQLTERQHHYHEQAKAGFVVPDFPEHETVRTQARQTGFVCVRDLNLTRAVQPTAYHIQARAVLALPFGYLLRALRLAPPQLLPHLRCCAAQPTALRELGSYRLLVLEKPGTD